MEYSIEDLNIGCNPVSDSKIAVLGGSTDRQIPVKELSQKFEFNCNVFNRSFENLSIKNAKQAYREYIQPLNAEAIIIHLGEADVEMFQTDQELFDGYYISLITEISENSPNAQILVVSIQNEKSSSVIENMNRHIKAIALSERCDFFNIDNAKLWKPENSKEFFSFINTFKQKNCVRKTLNEIANVLYSYALNMILPKSWPANQMRPTKSYAY